jgi:hypothetical protein
MHFEIHDHNLARLARVAKRIRNQEDDMTPDELLTVLNSKAGQAALQKAVRATVIPDAPQPDGSTADEHLGSLLRRVIADYYRKD